LKYRIFLGEKEIGRSGLESGDPPMGVAYGKIDFIAGIDAYPFFKKYCQENNIELTLDDEAVAALSTADLTNLRVLKEDGYRIEGEGGSYIEGMGNDFSVNILGIAYPFYGEEFPNLVKLYEDQFKDKK
jgi:hypothetical protein